MLLLTLLALTVQTSRPPLLVQDSSQKRIAIVEPDDSIRWERTIGPAHDFQMLPSGHVLMQDSWTHLLEVDPATDEVVWEYDARDALAAPPAEERAKDDPASAPVEVHAFQRLPGGRTMLALSGPSEIVEIDPDGTVAVRIRLTVDAPHPHHDTRLARKTAAGTYLVAHESDGMIREYDADGRVVWDYAVPLFGQPRAGSRGPAATGRRRTATRRSGCTGCGRATRWSPPATATA